MTNPMEVRLRPAALIAALLGISSAAAGQEAESAIFRAAVRSIHAELSTNGRRPIVSVDPRILVRLPAGSPPNPLPLHPSAVLAAVGDSGVSVVVTPEWAAHCTPRSIPDCRTNGIAAFVRFGVPEIEGDSATITAMIDVSRTPDAADSAWARRQRVPNPSFQRAVNVGTYMRLHFKRSDGAWRVVGRRILGQS